MPLDRELQGILDKAQKQIEERKQKEKQEQEEKKKKDDEARMAEELRKKAEAEEAENKVRQEELQKLSGTEVGKVLKLRLAKEINPEDKKDVCYGGESGEFFYIVNPKYNRLAKKGSQIVVVESVYAPGTLCCKPWNPLNPAELRKECKELEELVGGNDGTLFSRMAQKANRLRKLLEEHSSRLELLGNDYRQTLPQLIQKLGELEGKIEALKNDYCLPDKKLLFSFEQGDGGYVAKSDGRKIASMHVVFWETSKYPVVIETSLEGNYNRAKIVPQLYSQFAGYLARNSCAAGKMFFLVERGSPEHNALKKQKSGFEEERIIKERGADGSEVYKAVLKKELATA